jgi:hypothetical protein
VHVRIDSIEQAIRDCTPVVPPPLDEAGYRIGYAIVRDNLRIGRKVVADSVNPLLITRDAWLKVGQNAQVETVEIEVICSDSREHRPRVETRLHSDVTRLGKGCRQSELYTDTWPVGFNQRNFTTVHS